MAMQKMHRYMGHSGLLARSSALAAACVVLLLCLSCSRSIEFQLFNNTGVELLVICEHTQGTQPEIKMYKLPPGQSVVVEYANLLRINTPTAVWKYPTLAVDVERQTQKSRVPRIQIESNGELYLLPSGTEQITTLPPQPPGFPVKPIQQQP